MKGPWAYVSGLLDLHKLVDGDERRSTWRQSMATLARVSADEGPSPLEGLHPEALAKGVHAAIAHGLVDDLDWLAPPAAAVALYTLAAALPNGPEQKDIGRRAIGHLNVGNAETFCAMATRMALTAGKGLHAPGVRARVGIVVELPLSSAVADGPLALALCSARELAREWISIPSTGSLPARRLAARLLERAAREASKRAQQGDDHAMRVFKSDAIKDAWARLLDDRESLVWRHVAVARGLIAPWVPQLKTDVLGSLGANLTPTEWRRGATSLAAMLAVLPEPSVRAANTAIGGRCIERDPGVAAAFVWGISRAAEAEPEAAATLLSMVISRAPFEAGEAVTELFAEFGRVPFVESAAETALAALAKAERDAAKVTDDGRASLEREVKRDLAGDRRDDPSVREQLEVAVNVFATQGARAAYAAARQILASARGAIDTLDALALDEDESAEGKGGSMARRTSLAVMRDIDISLLERGLLSDLLKLGPAEAIRTHEGELDAMREHLAEWILARESTARSISEGLTSKGPRHPTLRLRRLRALLHLVDSDVGSQDDAARGHRLRKRWFRIASALLARFDATPPKVLRRTLFAALARALDALVRADALDVADVLLVNAQSFGDPADFTTLAEASMDPDLILVMGRYSAFIAACQASGAGQAAIEPSLVALEGITKELFPHTTSRGEALRNALVRLLAALKAIAAAPSLKALVGDEGETNVLASLETALASISKLSIGARARLDPDRVNTGSGPSSMSGPSSVVLASSSSPSLSSASLEIVPESALSVEVARVVSGAEPSLSDDTLANGVQMLVTDVPIAIASVVELVLGRLTSIAVERASLEVEIQPRVASEQLPAWVPARRTLGGFYLVRPLGAGGSGSVFLVNRVEDKADPDAEKFALKVPDYSASAARLLSESEFMDMFRAEASALIAVPSHPNLARFVTFDLAARPKPILVMELVEGATLEAGVQSRGLDMSRCFAVLDDVLQGLAAMHSVGVGHLDLKPSNVVLRKGADAVLVDFGLAGRHIRPGCATGPYGAPEVWGAVAAGAKPTPQAADVYAFGCLAFEALTGRILFQADNELAQVSMHIAHDGFPPLLKELAQHVGMAPLAELLFWTLRRDASLRPSAMQVREDLGRLAPQFTRLKWPLSI